MNDRSTPPEIDSVTERADPPSVAAALYSGKVMHHRMKPKVHRFTYSVFSLLIDLDRLDEADRLSTLFSVNSVNVISFHERDHGENQKTGLRQHVDSLLADQGLERPERVLLLAYPRILGYGFNPLSIYYAYDAHNRLLALVYEVRNTFGGMHTYVLPVEPHQVSEAGLRQEVSKAFYVSPFLDMNQHYSFRMLPPGTVTRVRILEKDAQGPILAATFSGTQKALSTSGLLRECFRVPFLSFKVMAAIHWEALKLWLKKVPFHPRSATNAQVERKQYNGPQDLASERQT